MPDWVNWSQSVRCQPARFEQPANEADLRALIHRARQSGEVLRTRGTGHSSMPLVATDDTLVSMDEFSGIFSHDPETLEVSVGAGTPITALGQPLLKLGLALQNQGDIDRQSVAGAIGTGTHGTGATLPNLSAQASEIRLFGADGEILDCSAESEPELWGALRVSLGALGVMSRVRLKTLPAYRLHEHIWRASVDECLKDLATLIAKHRHFEFFWLPSRDRCEMKTLSLTDAAPDDLDGLRGQRIGWSCDIISSVRELKFHEMEYAIPAPHGPDCFGEIRARILDRHADLLWPVEYRTVASDDAWLSPASQRETVTISIHQAAELDFRELFIDIEQIFRNFDGRPHWGKIHTQSADQLRALYPHWDRFREVRTRLDPRGRFLNRHLRELFEPA